MEFAARDGVCNGGARVYSSLLDVDGFYRAMWLREPKDEFDCLRGEMLMYKPRDDDDDEEELS